MSLDVWLEVEEDLTALKSSGIFVRIDGQTKEITRAEWDALYPNRAPVIAESADETTNTVYSGNITHNLNSMASEAGIYKHLWRPEELGIERAEQLIEPLKEGLALLNSYPERFKVHNPENGWGNYEGLCRFVAEYLNACIRFPRAYVRVSR